MADNENSLLRLDGLFRCSALICPACTESEGPQKHQGTCIAYILDIVCASVNGMVCSPHHSASLDVMSFVHCAAQQAFKLEFIPDELYYGPAEFLCQVADVMIRLQLHPLLPKICFPSLDSWDLSTPRPIVFESPSALSGWGEVEAVACRLFVTLEWASHKAEALCEDECSRLKHNLLVVWKFLLHGNLQDHRIGMQKVFR